jgi:enolase
MKGILHNAVVTSVGDEALSRPTQEQRRSLRSDYRVIKAAGHVPGKDIAIALDPAASSFYEDGAYNLAVGPRQRTARR